MDDFDVIVKVLLLMVLIAFILGLFAGQPSELDNGCLVHGDSVYCKETNE